MKIYTYENPYEITKASYWKDIEDYAHLCVSQTLVQGLTNLYGRDSFWIINTIETFLEHLNYYNTWTNSPENDIKQYLALTEEVKNVQQPNIKKAMRFNQKELHQSLRFLSELDLDANQFQEEDLTMEQKVFLTIYRNLHETAPWAAINELQYLSEDEVKDCFLELLNNEEKKEKKKLNQKLSRVQRRIVEKNVKNLEEINERFCQSIDQPIKGIVFHGIHQFSALQLKLFKQLEEMGIEVIFLINYHQGYMRVFETWEKVYQWTDLPMKKNENNDRFQSFDNIGKGIGRLLKGDITEAVFDNVTFYKYDNLTTFADHIANLFEQALVSTDDGKRKFDGKVLSRMDEQFYASNNEQINELLQAYFPEQFGDKHFLSYPIGQFILGLYNMWEEDERTLKVSSSILRECLSINFFEEEDQPSPLEIYNKIELYFKQKETLEDFTIALNELIKIVNSIERGQIEFGEELKGFSFYNVSFDELRYFQRVMWVLSDIARQLFDHQRNGYVNYKEHYRKLIEIIQDKTKKDALISEKEQELVTSLVSQFENLHELEIEGTIDDLKETIHFYLNRKNIENSANWIVRNFEQIDGGVLLSKVKGTRNKKYHFAMLSNKKMKRSINDSLSWPLSEAFFDSYQEEVKEVNVVLCSLREYSHFLRYSLFYGTYYLENETIFSFIENSEGEKDTPYFLLEMLGLSYKIRELSQTRFNVGENGNQRVLEERIINVGDLAPFATAELQKFSTCSYRYILDHLLEKKSYFQSEYHCRLYYTSLLYKKAAVKYFIENDSDDYEEIVKEVNQKLRKYFPFWRNIDFYDIEARVNGYFKGREHTGFDPYYYELRSEFLYAKVTEGRYNDEGENLIKVIQYFREDRAEHNQNRLVIQHEIKKFLNSKEIFQKQTHPDICNYCKHRELCLNHFKEG